MMIEVKTVVATGKEGKLGNQGRESMSGTYPLGGASNVLLEKRWFC